MGLGLHAGFPRAVKEMTHLGRTFFPDPKTSAVYDDLYRNVFAFSLSELQSFESLKTEKVRDAIYSAGIGIG